MNEQQFRTAIENSSVFLKFPKFKRDIIIRRPNMVKMFDLYGQAKRYGLGYLKQNPNLTQTEVSLVESLLCHP